MRYVRDKRWVGTFFFIPASLIDFSHTPSCLQLYYGPVSYNHSVLRYVHDSHYHEVPRNRGTLLPAWYSTPLVSRYPCFNMDLLSAHENGAATKALASHRPVLGEAYNLVEGHREVEFHEGWYRDVLEPEDDATEPISYLHYPLIDWDMDALKLEYNRTDSAGGPEDKPKLVGMMVRE
jgi:hypothetical protein